ncbi:MAG: hypothetical protein LBO71_06920 [Prevotellaceae bacterium]|nr:hypothetical protein [Prevotellaceae bacterium]
MEKAGFRRILQPCKGSISIAAGQRPARTNRCASAKVLPFRQAEEAARHSAGR